MPPPSQALPVPPGDFYEWVDSGIIDMRSFPRIFSFNLCKVWIASHAVTIHLVAALLDRA